MPKTSLTAVLILAALASFFCQGCVTLKIKPTEEILSESAGPKEKPEEEDRAFLLYEEVGGFVQRGNLEEAVQKLEESYQNLPQDSQGRIIYANLLMLNGRVPEAEGLLLEILAEEPENLEALFSISLLERLRGNFREEKSFLERTLSINPGYIPALVALGNLYLSERNVNSSRVWFEKALQEDPRNTDALIGYGNILLEDKNPREAEKFFSRALESSPEYVYAYIDRSRARLLIGDNEGALSDLSKAIELEPGDPWNYFDRGKLFLIHLGRLEEAKADFDRVLELEPSNFLAYYYRGEVFNSLNRIGEAVSDYRQVLSLQPSYYYVHQPLGYLLYIEESWSEASDHFEKAYLQDRSNYAYPILISLSMKRGGKEKEARTYLEKAIQTIPRETLFYSVARTLLDPGYDTIALRAVDAEKAVYVKTQMLYYLGVHYYLQGKSSLALRYFLEVKDRNYRNLQETRLAEWELLKMKSQ